MNVLVLRPQATGGTVDFEELVKEALQAEAEVELRCEPCGKNERHILRGNVELPAEQRILVVVIELFRRERTGEYVGITGRTYEERQGHHNNSHS